MIESDIKNVFIEFNGSYISSFKLSFDCFDIGYSNNKLMAFNFHSFNNACKFLYFVDTLQPGFSKFCNVV